LPNADQLETAKKNVRDGCVLFEHKEGSKLVDTKDIGALVRSLGVNPSGAQVTIIIDQLAALNSEGQNNSLLSMEHIEIVVANFLVQQKKALFRDDYHTLLRAFRALDQEGKGFVDAEHLRTLMCSRGEPMTEEEVNKMLGNAVNEDGKLKLYYVSTDP
jgi:Ca2+-binding EF-hand superfamily protein